MIIEGIVVISEVMFCQLVIHQSNLSAMISDYKKWTKVTL